MRHKCGAPPLKGSVRRHENRRPSFRQESMTSAPTLRPGPLALVLSISIILAWIASAIALDQSLFATQRSSQLLGIGALNGELFRTEGWWRLLASQYVHAHFPHMIFNALGVLLIGSVVERSGGRFDLAIVYFL